MVYKMIFFYRAIKLYVVFIISFYLAKYLASSIIADNYIFAVVITSGACFLMLTSLNQKFMLFTATVFVNLSFRRFIINDIKWVELMGPLICLLLIGDVLINKKNILSKKALIYFVAIGVIIVWSMINYGRNPVTAGFIGGGIKESGIRGYFIIGVGLTIFFSSYLFFKSREFPKLLTISLYLSLFIGNLLLIHYFVPEVPLPFFKLMKTSVGQYSTYFRIPGVGEMASLGIISLLVLRANKKINIAAILIFTNFMVLLVLSGGRMLFIGTCLTILVYVLLVKKKYFLPLLMVFILLSGVYVFVSESITLPGQLERIIDVKGGIEHQDQYRWAAYQNYFEIFKENPVFGKGIGWREAKGEEEMFATAQLMRGGHGSYISILAIYGIGGVFFLLTMLTAGIYHSYRSFKDKLDFDDDNQLALFSFLNLFFLALIFYSSGNGFDNMKLWFFAGLAAGITVKDEMRKYES